MTGAVTGVMYNAPCIHIGKLMSDQPFARSNPRDHRIDLIRGVALTMIFINHVPGNMFERVTSRNFGFSDAAEAFVLLAGISAALAYGRGFSDGVVWRAALRPWGRAWSLYQVHLMLSLAVLALVAGLMRFGGNPALMLGDNFDALLRDPLGVFVGLPLMLHQFGYVNILPLYVLLLLATPAALWLGIRRPMGLLAGSVGLWLLAGTARVNLTTYPGLNGWFLNPLSWQLIFVVGLLIGLRLKADQRLVPVHPKLMALAAGYLGVSLVWVSVPQVAHGGRALLGALADLGVPRLFVQFDKGYVELPRLLHVLSLAYLASAWPALRTAAAAPGLRLLAVMGRQALPVFAFGTMLSFVARILRTMLDEAGYPAGLPLDASIILCGIALQIGLALLCEAAKSRKPQEGPLPDAMPATGATLAPPGTIRPIPPKTAAAMRALPRARQDHPQPA